MLTRKRLLLTVSESGGSLRARYALVKGKSVLSEGEAALKDLPPAGDTRVSFFARSGYFDRTDIKAKSPKMLPILTRRVVEGSLAFSEPFTTRLRSKEASPGLYRVDLLAVADSDFSAVTSVLPLQARAISNVTLVEAAIAGLVAQETSEPATVLWLRGNNLLGLVVEGGTVLSRMLDRGAGDTSLVTRVERMRGSLTAACRRTFPDREVSLHLALGDLYGNSELLAEREAVSTAFESRIGRLFSGGELNAALRWPEVYGLALLPAEFNLLDLRYQQQAMAEQAATILGGMLLAGGLLTSTVAVARYLEWQHLANDYEARRATVAKDYAELSPRLPSPAHLAALEQRIKIENGATDFRVDALLAWISSITPKGAIIRNLEAGSPKSNGQTPPAAANAAGSSETTNLAIGVEWELQGSYPEIEKLSALLAEQLGTRGKLASSNLEYLPGKPARLSTIITPLPGAFRQ